MSCGCGDGNRCLCDERTPRTPLAVHNSPGQPVLHRRVVTQATAKSTMLRALSDPGLPGTTRFTARNDDDFAVALVDAAAVVADIVSFYTDRFVNEHYLRTASERRSLVELSRLIGYQPRPGLAPTADLVFTLDTSPGAPAASVIPAGTAVQSSPDPGQSPVIYETLADIGASPAWNAVLPRRTRPHPVSPGSSLSFAGVVSLSVGDGVLFGTDGAGNLAFGLVSSVTDVAAVPDLPGKPGSAARTDVSVSTVTTMVAKPPSAVAPRAAQDAPVPDTVSWLAGRTLSAADLDGALLGRSMTLADIAGPFAAARPAPATAVVLGQQRALFGSQAPLASTIAASVADQVAATTGAPPAVKSWAAALTLPWESATAATFPGAASGDVYLDGGSPSVAVGSLMILRDASSWGGYQVTSAAGVGVAANGISGRAVRVHLDSATGLQSFSLRRTTAYTGARVLPLADVPAPDRLPVGPIELGGLLLGLREGRPVVVTGEPADDRGHVVCLPTALHEVVHDFGPARSTTITLADTPAIELARSTVRIAANVAPASQGETRREVLGSGDGRTPFQSFTLRQPPLTHLSSSSASGLSSTLTIWVDGVRWRQVEALLTAGPDDHVYVVRATDTGSVVQFGDGVTGARLPSGTANVTAVYRSGASLAGRVRAEQLTLPVSRAGGVSGVTNPAASVGGDDPETVDSARVSAPLRVTTLDRIVSMDDYALYARAFPGVAKAQAVWARAGRHRGVLLTVAGDSGAILVPQNGVGASLLGALRTYGDQLVPVSLVPYVPRSFRFAATVRTDPDRIRADVLSDAGHRLAAAFSYPARDLGQPVTASEVLSVVQGTTGVVAATVTAMWKFDPGSLASDQVSGPPASALGVEVLPAAAPSPGAEIGALVGAELIVLDSAPITWGVLP